MGPEQIKFPDRMFKWQSKWWGRLYPEMTRPTSQYTMDGGGERMIVPFCETVPHWQLVRVDLFEHVMETMMALPYPLPPPPQAELPYPKARAGCSAPPHPKSRGTARPLSPKGDDLILSPAEVEALLDRALGFLTPAELINPTEAALGRVFDRLASPEQTRLTTTLNWVAELRLRTPARVSAS